MCRDEEDYVIEEGTTHLVWSGGRGPLFGLAGLNLADQSNTVNGFARVRQVRAGRFLFDVGVRLSLMESAYDKLVQQRYDFA